MKNLIVWIALNFIVKLTKTKSLYFPCVQKPGTLCIIKMNLKAVHTFVIYSQLTIIFRRGCGADAVWRWTINTMFKIKWMYMQNVVPAYLHTLSKWSIRSMFNDQWPFFTCVFKKVKIRSVQPFLPSIKVKGVLMLRTFFMETWLEVP